MIFAEVAVVSCESLSCFGTYKNLHFFLIFFYLVAVAFTFIVSPHVV